MSQLPEDSRNDAPLVVAENIADARHLFAGDFRVTGFQLGRNVAARLREDFNAALDKPLPSPVCLKSIESHIS